ncbi:predicted protein [Arabidopsis lyrata subsp. lyrata]|uniref:Predicted protein n=1 Tax=Arabidopsis lyrata subsp. lyrata TaxID=81972 RepID=D7MUT5_ARALL|nr:predicted protein [Arabidopsis lyrata subsp. lyrata]
MAVNSNHRFLSFSSVLVGFAVKRFCLLLFFGFPYFLQHRQQVKAHMDSHFGVETPAEKKLEDVMPIATGHEKRSLKLNWRVEESSNTATKRKEGGRDVVVAESEELRIEESSNTELRGVNLRKPLQLLERSGKVEEIGAEAKMELFGLHKIATEGSCREAQPMAVMVTARAKWYHTFRCFYIPYSATQLLIF